MNIENGKFYTSEKSNIVVLVRGIVREDEHSITADTIIFKKSNGAVLESNSEYVLSKERIKHWQEHKDA